jgi:hypothetical protein
MFDQRSWHCWYCLVHSHQKVICFLFFYFTKSVYRLETCDPIKRSFSGITTPRTVFFLLFSSYCFLLYWCVCVCVCVYIDFRHIFSWFSTFQETFKDILLTHSTINTSIPKSYIIFFIELTLTLFFSEKIKIKKNKKK